MGSIKYIIKGTNNPSTIYVRFKHGRSFDFTKSTSLLINPKYWNCSKGQVKQIAEFSEKKNLQNKLNDLESHLLNQFNDSFTQGGVINGNWFSTTVKRYFDQDYDREFVFFLDYAEHFYSSIPTKVQRSGKVGLANNTLKRYRTIINKLKEFETFRKSRLKIGEIDMKFYNDFKYFMNTDQKLNYNTTGRYLTYVKTICLEARKQGLKVSADVEKQEFRQTREATSFITLSEDEIKSIFEYDFSSKPYLQNARDWLIIGVWSGARVSDLLRFTSKNLSGEFLEYTSKKTNQKVILPLHPNVKSILQERHKEFPKLISSQKFNDYIKQVCKYVGIEESVEGAKKEEVEKGVWRKKSGSYEKWELVSSHICRRSFATNHYGKLPTPVLMAITGHSTEKMFLKYIGKTAKDSAIQLQKYWNKIGD